MTEIERLIELLLQSEPLHERDLDDDLCDGEVEAIADYLLANGVIVPPCKNGDVVYRLAHGYAYEERFRCAHVTYLTNGYGFGEKDIGVVAFIGEHAKEEAEKALAERSKG